MLASGCYRRHFYVVLQVFEPLEEHCFWHRGVTVGTFILVFYKCLNHLGGTGLGIWAPPSALLQCVLQVFEPLEEH